mmetsp:Transcript_31227/g.78171  ORF Transcript_31227/g.78171 Transcript_31227/m.78171 type:complete len:209 (+) Transcript_31227:1103-1729(+)
MFSPPVGVAAGLRTPPQATQCGRSPAATRAIPVWARGGAGRRAQGGGRPSTCNPREAAARVGAAARRSSVCGRPSHYLPPRPWRPRTSSRARLRPLGRPIGRSASQSPQPDGAPPPPCRRRRSPLVQQRCRRSHPQYRPRRYLRRRRRPCRRRFPSSRCSLRSACRWRAPRCPCRIHSHLRLTPPSPRPSGRRHRRRPPPRNCRRCCR